MGKPIRVACIGDSITEYGGYPNKLQALLGSNYIVENFGVSGATLTTNSTLPYISRPQFQDALKYQPDIVIIMLGTNEASIENMGTNTDLVDQYSYLINAFQNLQGTQLIWIAKPPPIITNPNFDSDYLENIVIPQILTVSDQLNLPLIDIPYVVGSDIYFADGVHPTYEGSTLIAAVVYNAITLPDGSPDITAFGEGYIG
ncbi:MAG: GDSL-type esterase/lipase family protein [Candidatus Bathyarchaeota archaeon]|nr:GDSL-type esterase/lipase family protein [Candidatus Termitimicrobium sp.]